MVKVWDVLVPCRETVINDLFGCIFWTRHDLADKIEKKTLDDLKGWLAR